MTKKEFLSGLRKKLVKLNRADLKERLGFYSEIIDDKMEEGLSEEDAVFQLGSAQEIAKQIIADTPLLKIVKSKNRYYCGIGRKKGRRYRDSFK